MKWINRLIPKNGNIIEKVDLNCVIFCKCEGEPQRLLYIFKKKKKKGNYNIKNTFIHKISHTKTSIIILYYSYILNLFING